MTGTHWPPWWSAVEVKQIDKEINWNKKVMFRPDRIPQVRHFLALLQRLAVLLLAGDQERFGKKSKLK